MMSDKVPCSSCGTSVAFSEENIYCPHCGQRQFKERFRIPAIFKEMVSVFFNLERGLLPTTVKLTTAPGEVVKGYWDGATRKFYNPLRYAFVMVTISTLITLGSGVYDQQMVEVTQSSEGFFNPQLDPSLSEEERQIQQDWNNKVQENTKKYLNVISLLGIPFGALSLRLLFVDRKRYYGEHIIAACYYIGHTSLLGIPLILLALFGVLGPIENSIIALLVNLIYGIWMIKKIYDVSWLRSIISGPLSAIITFIAVMIVSFIVGTVSYLISNVWT